MKAFKEYLHCFGIAFLAIAALLVIVIPLGRYFVDYAQQKSCMEYTHE